jgi:hypothetical protein
MENSITLSELEKKLAATRGLDEPSVVFDTPYLLLDLTEWRSDSSDEVRNDASLQPGCPVIALTDDDTNLPGIVDLVADSELHLKILTEAICANQAAATILVQLLRHNEKATLIDGLFAESLSYSCLQGSSSFQAWLSQRDRREMVEEDATSLVLMKRQQDELSIILNRPDKRNAYSAGLRDALYEALMLVATDHTISSATVSGAGDCFSAGGDLDEFGEATDGAHAHLVRSTRSTGLLLDQLRAKVGFRLHGACIGAGIELPSFSKRVTAAEDSFFQLPEVAMGLIPGAGGTVSILRRIGRHRTAYMAISNQKISSKTALEWGLIDAVS